ncbi:MAG: hypothetical protein ACTSWY_01115 [Promethearchaeota archaeon]
MGRLSKKKETDSSVNVKLRNMKSLNMTGRLKEAVAYLYLIYVDLVRQKFGVAKKYSQTIRDFAIIMVKNYKQNPQNVYPFIQRIEQTVYGDYTINQGFFKDLLQHFGKLYLELTGNPLPPI